MSKKDGIGLSVGEFCRTKTEVFQLCVIRDCGWIVETCWIDYEDIFRLSKETSEKKVKDYEFGTLPIRNHNGKKLEVPCLYIDV